MLEINSSKNPIIKNVKSLYRKKNRWNQRLFIIEGIKIIEEAMELPTNIKYVFFSEELFKVDGGDEFFSKIKDREGIIKLPKQLFKQISDVENPQGVLAVVEFEERNIDKIYKIDSPFIIFLDRLNDPGNLGTIIRSADAFGVDAIVMGEGTVDQYNSKVVRATMGSLFRIPIYNVKDNKSFFDKLGRSNINIVTTSLSGRSLEKEDFSKGFIIVVGNESSGVSSQIIDRSTKEVRIPMVGGAESLNAGVAASIVMYEAMKSRN